MGRIYSVYVVDVDSEANDELDALGTISEFKKRTRAWKYAQWLMHRNPSDRVVFTSQKVS
jgi:hypothetical protein